MSSLSELIERVEKASGPDRELDAAIGQATVCEGWRVDDDGSAFCWVDDPEYGEGWMPNGEVPPYTASIDTALTLLPEKHGYYIRENCSSDGDEIYCNAQVWPYSDPPDDDAPRYWANSKQGAPALALVAACLKARLLDAASSEARG